MTEPDDPRTAETPSVEAEARRLMESLGAWASAAGGGTTDDAQAAGGCSCNPAPKVCRVCPVCRVGAVVESLSPDLVDRLADLVAMVAGSLKVIADDRRQEQQTPAEQDRQEPEREHVPKDDRAFDGFGDTDDEGERRP